MTRKTRIAMSIHGAHDLSSTMYPLTDDVEDIDNELGVRLISAFGRPAQNAPTGGVPGPGVTGLDVLGVFTCERL